jgi:hypothetical protein
MNDQLRPVLIRMLEGRVGSTLVMQLLGTSPEVAFDRTYPYENSYLTYFTRLTGQISAGRRDSDDMADLVYGDGTRVGPLPFEPARLDRPALAGDALRGVWSAFSRAVDALGGSPRLYAEKYWGDVQAVIDAGLDPVVIDLVRDPRDVVASVRGFNAKTGRPRFGRAQAADDRDHLRRLVLGMGFRMVEFAQPLAATRMTLRYEDLIGDLPAQAAALASQLGVTLDAASVRAAVPSMAGHMTSRTPESSVARWSRDLAPEEIAMIERRLSRHMETFGYLASSSVRDGPAELP